MDKTIYIVRHGETDFNKKKIIQGSGVDSSLNDKGRAQAAALFAKYKTVPFDVVLTSKLQRTQQTIQSFIDLSIPHESFAEINEMNWGIHEGKPGDEKMIKTYAKLIQEWDKGNFDARIPEGESAQELSDRLTKFVAHIAARKEQKILVCTHGRAIRCLISVLKKLPLQTMEENKHANTGLYLVHQRGNSFEFELENDISHL